MSKELDEIKSIIFTNFGALGFYNPTMNDEILKDRDKVLNCLSRLESIDNSNPSEALKLVDYLINTKKKYNVEWLKRDFITIKQALLKTQGLENRVSIETETKQNMIKKNFALQKENQKYKKLEEEIDCPLDVIGKLRKANYIYRDDGVVFGFIGINFNDDDKLILYNDDECNIFTSDLRLKDYKKTWWLKEERSE